jgi:hypothetical protein
MRFWKLIIPIIVIILVLFNGCVKIHLKEPSDSENSSSDPIIGEWVMTRSSIQPSLPLPEIALNQFIPDKGTWKFSRQSGKLTLKYDGRDTWYKTIPGLDINRKPTTVSEVMGKAPYIFSGGGGLNLDQLPIVLSQLFNRKMEQISFNYTDDVQVILPSNNRISSTISVNISGKYYGETEIPGTMKWKTLDQSFTIIYDGDKK